MSDGAKTDAVASAYENTLSIDELRREVRRAWDQDLALNMDLLNLPEIPSIDTMRALTHAAMGTHRPNVSALGKQMQRDNPGAVPFKCEYECATGLWSLIRAGILSAKDADQ